MWRSEAIAAWHYMEVNGQLHALAALYSGDSILWFDPKTCMEAVVNRKIFAPFGNQKPILR